MSPIGQTLGGDLFELRFASLSMDGRSFAFPCDSSGNVDIDQLPSRLRTNYLFARAAIGFELYYPVVCRCDLH
jgi:hypothetical protein